MHRTAWLRGFVRGSGDPNNTTDFHMAHVDRARRVVVLTADGAHSPGEGILFLRTSFILGILNIK